MLIIKDIYFLKPFIHNFSTAHPQRDIKKQKEDLAHAGFLLKGIE